MTTLNFKETAELIAAVGNKLTVLVRGEPGIGKSSLGQYIRDKYYPSYNLIMFDAAVRSEGDVALPWLMEVNGKQVTTYAPTELFGLHLEGPSILLIDELTKGTPSTINALLPAMLERRFNSIPFHPDTIVMCTGNLSTDLVGDSLLAHALNRVMDITMRKPLLVNEEGRPSEWLQDYAIPMGAPVAAIGFCVEYPQIFADYHEGTRNNPYIYRPGNVTSQFVTPRSFSKLIFEHLPQRNNMSQNSFYAGMVGLVGKACADSFMLYLQLESDLPTTMEVLDDPMNCRLPATPVSQLMMCYRLAQSVRKPTVDKVVVYVRRLTGELRALFTHIVTTQQAALLPDMLRLRMLADNQDVRTA